MRDVEPAHLTAEAAIALAVRERDAAGLKAALIASGYLPGDRADVVDADLALRFMRHATRWYAVPGMRRFSGGREPGGRDRERPGARQRERGSSHHSELPGEERTAIKTQVNQFTVPPQSILIRRMHVMVAVVLQNLRAGADWGAIAAEYLHRASPATALGQAEAEFFARRGR